MMKIDPKILEKLIDDVLSDCIKSSKLVEKVIEAINDMEPEVVSYPNYSFTCPECGEHTHIEEVLPGSVLTSVVTNIALDDDHRFIMEYGATSTEGGDIESIRYQCLMCGYHLSDRELMELAL